MNIKTLKKHKWTIAILSILIIFGFILRFYSLNTNPLWFDETISSLASKNIAEKGIPQFDSGLLYSRAIIFHYLQGISIFLFGATDTAVRLVSVLFGLATIILAFLIGKEFNKPTGVISALLTTFLFLEVLYSRQARFYQAFQFLFFLTIFLLYKSKESKKYAWIASISLIILVQTQIAGLVLVPFFIYFFYKEHKDFKLLIIPILVTIYFGIPFLGIDKTTSLGSVYAEQYSSQIFNSLRAFFLISILGIPFAYKINKRMFYFLLVPSLIMFIGLFFIKVFATRYSYFLILSMIIFISTVFSYIYRNNKILGIIALLIAIIYPSNIFFETNYLTIVKPQEINPSLTTEPVIDYKSLNTDTMELIKTNILVTLSSPGAEWYLKKPDYVIPFSLNGLDKGFALYNEVDAYTGAEQWNGQVSEFIFLEDYFGYSKLDPTQIAKLNEMKNNCNIIEQSNTLTVYSCEIT